MRNILFQYPIFSEYHTLPTLFKEFRKIITIGKAAYESFMYGSGYFLLPVYILAE
jgi:hypothetical protein